MKPSEVNIEVYSDGGAMSIRKVTMKVTHLPTGVSVEGEGYSRHLLRDSLWKDLEKKVAEHLALPTNAPISTWSVVPSHSLSQSMPITYTPGVWYPWIGGLNPVSGMMVNVRLRSGSEINNTASDHIRWSWLQWDGDVMEFMVL